MREAILRACFEVFARKGIRAAGVDDLVAHAGVARAAFYGCLGSKEAAAQAYLQHLYLAWAEAFEAGVAARGEGPEALLGLFDAVEALCGDEGTRCASFVHVLAEAGPEDPLGLAANALSNRLRADIAGLAEAAGLPRAEEFAGDCQLLLDGAILSRSAGSRRALEDARGLARSLIGHRQGEPAPA